MKLIIDLPDKTIAHIRSDYGHKYFGAIRDDDKKIIMKAVYNGTPLEDIAKEFTEQNIQVMVWGNGVVPLVDLRDCVKIIDNHIAELKGE